MSNQESGNDMEGGIKQYERNILGIFLTKFADHPDRLDYLRKTIEGDSEMDRQTLFLYKKELKRRIDVIGDPNNSECKAYAVMLGYAIWRLHADSISAELVSNL